MFLLKLLAGVSVLVVLLLANLADGKALPGSSPSSIKTLDQSAATLPLLTSSMTRSQSAKTGAAEGSEESSEEEEEEEEGEGEEEEEETKKEEEGEVEKKEEETKVKGEKEKSAGESPKDEVTKLQEESQPTDKKEEIRTAGGRRETKRIGPITNRIRRVDQIAGGMELGTATEKSGSPQHNSQAVSISCQSPILGPTEKSRRRYRSGVVGEIADVVPSKSPEIQ